MRSRGYIITILCSILLIGCRKDDAGFTSTPISFGAEESSLSKSSAAEYTINTLTASGFKCSAFNVSDNLQLWSNVTASYASSSFSTDKYWPLGKTLNFYAVYPNTCSLTNESGAQYINVGTSASNYAGKTDLLVAKAYGKTIANSTGGKVSLNFTHPLCYLNTLNVKLSETSPNFSIAVRTVSISGPAYAQYLMPKTNASDQWRSRGSLKSYQLYSGNTAVSGVSSVSVPMESLMLIPTSDGNYQISVTIDLKLNGSVYANKTATVNIALSAGQRNALTLTYDVIQGKLQSTVSLSPWGDGNTYDKEMDEL